MQIVGYETDAADDPALLIAEDGAIRHESLRPGAELAYTLEQRRCAGITDGESHVACSATTAPYCEAHASTWVCARCTGTCLKDEMDCYEDHAVYLAAFAPEIFKVGVTRLWRLETRLREQGADRAAHVHSVSNGRIARELEADLATTLTDRVRTPDKIAGLHESVDMAAWNALLEEHTLVERFTFEYGLDLDERPVHETLVSGRVVGTKGRILVLENANTTYAVDMRDLVGYELSDGAPDRDLQSSLVAFG